MALFNKNKKESVRSAPQQKADATRSQDSGTTRDLTQVLKHARITEKATERQGASVYTFDVAAKATKRDIIAAMQAIYKVSPRKVAVVSVPKKVRRSMRTGKLGVSGGGKKAYVYLKSGESIIIS